MGVIEQDERSKKSNEFYKILLELGKQHAELSHTDKPSVKFITKLKELIETKAARVFDVNYTGKLFNESSSPFIGYCDDKNYYLFSETTYKLVVDFCNKQGDCFPIGLKTLLKHLGDENIIQTINNEKTPRKTIKGKTSRFIWIPKNKIDEED